MLSCLSVWRKVQMFCTMFSRCNSHPVIFWFIKIQNGSTFTVLAYPGRPVEETFQDVLCCSRYWMCRVSFICKCAVCVRRCACWRVKRKTSSYVASVSRRWVTSVKLSSATRSSRLLSTPLIRSLLCSGIFRFRYLQFWVASQQIGCEEHLRYDIFCIEWDVKHWVRSTSAKSKG